MKAKKLLRLFIGMPFAEKCLIILLAAALIISLGRGIEKIIDFSVNSSGTVIAEGAVGRIDSINPLFIDFNDADRDISHLVFSGLMRYDPEEKNFFPDLAASWERSRDGLTYTFYLRTDAKWHDGNPVTVDDVIFTYKDIIQDPGFKNPILFSAFEGVKVESLNPGVITFTLAKPSSYFISNLLTGILPTHILKDTPVATLESSPFNRFPVGSGPYYVDSASFDSDGDRVSLTAFEDYYGKKPNFERIRYYTFPNEKTLIKERGALHAAGKIPSSSEYAKTLEEDTRFTIRNYTLNQFTALYFNTENAFLRDQKVRRALLTGLDKSAIIPAGERRTDTIGGSEQKDNPVFAYDVTAAAKALNDAGYTKRDTDGVMINSKGDALSLSMLVAPKITPDLPAKIIEQWQALGVQISINSPEHDEDFIPLLSERRYDMLLARQGLGYNKDIYPLLHSSQIASEENGFTGLNFANFKSFRTDGLTEAIRKEQDPKTKEKLLAQLSGVLMEETPVIFLSTAVYSYALDNRIMGYEEHGAFEFDFHADRFSIIPYLSFNP